jgi:hypothetical protein
MSLEPLGVGQVYAGLWWILQEHSCGEQNISHGKLRMRDEVQPRSLVAIRKAAQWDFDTLQARRERGGGCLNFFARPDNMVLISFIFITFYVIKSVFLALASSHAIDLGCRQVVSRPALLQYPSRFATALSTP